MPKSFLLHLHILCVYIRVLQLRLTHLWSVLVGVAPLAENAHFQNTFDEIKMLRDATCRQEFGSIMRRKEEESAASESVCACVCV